MSIENTPLSAQTAVRIAAAMVREITKALRPDRALPPTDADLICAIARTANVRLPEIDQQNAAFERLKAEARADARRLSQVGRSQPQEESA